MNEMTHRTKTRPVKVGNLTIGGNNELIIQSMTTTKTHDVEATVAEIKRLEEAGCQVVRVAVPDERAANAIADIKKQINIPLVADIHFDYRLALKAIEGGIDKVRINPGNIGRRHKVEAVVNAAKNAVFNPYRCKRRFIRTSHFRKVRIPNCRWYGGERLASY